MPGTPGQVDDERVQLSLPITSLPSPHTTCPPEDNREYHAPREERSATPDSMPDLIDATDVQQLPTPEADAVAGATDDTRPNDDTSKRLEDVEDDVMRDSPSPTTSSEESKESDSRLAQSMSAAALSPTDPASHTQSIYSRTRVCHTKGRPMVPNR